MKNSNCLKKSSKQQHQYQCLQVYQVVNMMQQNLLIFLTFSTVFSLPIEDNVETLEAKAAKKAAKKLEDDEAARNARFNFGYSIQVSFFSQLGNDFMLNFFGLSIA